MISIKKDFYDNFWHIPEFLLRNDYFTENEGSFQANI